MDHYVLSENSYNSKIAVNCLLSGWALYLHVCSETPQMLTVPGTKPSSGLAWPRIYQLTQPLFLSISLQEKITNYMKRINSLKVENEAEQSNQTPCPTSTNII